MGAECPNGHGRQNIVANLTADQTSPKRSADVVAVRLKCGCVVGGTEYKEFQEALAQIQTEEFEAIEAAKKTSKDKKGAALKAYVLSGA